MDGRAALILASHPSPLSSVTVAFLISGDSTLIPFKSLQPHLFGLVSWMWHKYFCPFEASSWILTLDVIGGGAEQTSLTLSRQEPL